MGPGLPDRLGRGYARSFGAVSDMCPESLAPDDLNRVVAIVARLVESDAEDVFPGPRRIAQSHLSRLVA